MATDRRARLAGAQNNESRKAGGLFGFRHERNAEKQTGGGSGGSAGREHL